MKKNEIRLIKPLQKIKDKIQSILHNKEYKRVGENVIALSFLNGIYFLSPLILIPYLMHTIGSEFYGLYIFSWTFIYYYIFIVNYGFDYSSTREIAIHRNNKQKISEIFSTTFYCRILLLLISFIILAFCLLFINKFNENAKLILLGIGVITGQAFFPTWLFQGMEEMKFITIVNSIMRILPIILVFIFVKSAKDSGFVILFQSIGFLAGGIFSHIFAIKHFHLQLTKPVFSEIKKYLSSGLSLFLSTVGVSLYRETNTVILGFLTSNFELVGYYALADKFIRIIQLIANAFSQALFPFLGRNLIENRAKTVTKFINISAYYSVFLIACCVGLFVFIPFILNIYLGGSYPEIIRDIRIMSPVILVGGLNYYFGVAGMINFNHKNAFTTFVLIAGIINIILCLILGRTFVDAGAALSLSIAETILLLLIVIYLQKKEKIFSKNRI